MVFCCDSNVFIWGIKEQSNPAEMHRIAEALRFFDWCDKLGFEIMFPSVVIAECLALEPIDRHAAIMRIVYESFRVVNFDEKSALRYANILNQDKFKQALSDSRDLGISRAKMKVDFLIVACAVAHGAGKIISNDIGLRKFAEGILPVDGIPAIPK